MTGAISGALALALMVGQVFAQAPTPPTMCKAVLSSSEGGRLEVSKFIQPPRLEAAYPTSGLISSLWSPAAPGASTTLKLHYEAADQDKRIGRLDQVEVDFPVPEGVSGDQITGEVIVTGAPPLHLDKAAGIMGTDKFGFLLDGTQADDRAVGQLIGQGARVKVVIYKADKVRQPEMFEGSQMSLLVLGEPKVIISEEIDTTAIAARDALFVRAKAPVVASDPKVCKPLHYQSGVLVDDSAGE